MPRATGRSPFSSVCQVCEDAGRGIDYGGVGSSMRRGIAGKDGFTVFVPRYLVPPL